MKVLFCTSEAYPFAMSGGLGDVSSALPAALRERVIGCRVVMPLYEDIKDEFREKMTFIKSITVPVSWRRQYCGIFEAKHNGVTYYFIDNQYYFKRHGLYGYFDDAERFAFFSRAILEMLPVIGFYPDIIHCNDWQTALVPTYLSLFYNHNPGYEKIKTVLTIHNIQYQGKYGMEVLEDVLGIPMDKKPLLEYGGDVNILKGGIETAQMVTTVSPTYSREIMDPWFSHGLHDILKLRSWKLHGIVNGIDTTVYDPQNDDMIYAPYSADDLKGKAENKKQLQRDLSLPERDDVAVVGMVSRLVGHKGFDLVKYAFEELMQSEIQLVILGSGEWTFESYFDEMAQKYPEKFALRTGFDISLAHKIYAGSDFFLMPSKSEPCGLSQMIALRYGAVPIVRETGGLKDTITDCGNAGGNGFTFKTYNAGDMTAALYRGLSMYYDDRKKFAALQKRAMECDNSWKRSAGEYIRLYKSLIKQQ